MDTFEFQSFGVNFLITNIEKSLRDFYISQQIDPSNDTEVVFYLKNKFGYHHISHCKTIAEERPFLEMILVGDLAENAYLNMKPSSEKNFTPSLSTLLLSEK